MNNELGEVFYKGRIFNLSSTEVGELKNVLSKLREDKTEKKEEIEETLEQMRRV